MQCTGRWSRNDLRLESGGEDLEGGSDLEYLATLKTLHVRRPLVPLPDQRLDKDNANTSNASI